MFGKENALGQFPDSRGLERDCVGCPNWVTFFKSISPGFWARAAPDATPCALRPLFHCPFFQQRSIPQLAHMLGPLSLLFDGCASSAALSFSGVWLVTSQTGSSISARSTTMSRKGPRSWPGGASQQDVWTYLRDALTRLPTMTNRQVKDITPKAWAETQELKQRAA